MSPLSAHSVSAAAIPANQNGTTKITRNSLFGAVLAAGKAANEGTLRMTEDSLRVSPQTPGDALWEWVQPVLSSGGHILGAPVANPDTAQAEVLEMGIRIMTKMYEGKMFAPKRPEHAIPVLCVLAATFKEDNEELYARLTQKLLSVVQYAAEPPLDKNMGIAYDAMFLGEVKYPWVQTALSEVDMFGLLEGSHQAPSWKQIKRSFIEGECSNKKARYIRRVMITHWPRKHRKMRTATLRHECTTPIPSAHPLLDYVEKSWMLRTSSISSRLAKTPPAIVYETMETLGLTRETDASDTLRVGIIQKFKIFQEWVIAQHGPNSSPSVWSDTLSKFANSINPLVKRYNEQLGTIELMQASSFVPGDLAPEMYARDTRTGYFFLNGGMYYSYSKAWRRDAFVAYLDGRLPKKVDALNDQNRELLRKHISIRLAHDGGSNLLQAIKKAGVTELEFTKFLRQFYWSGAFLEINLQEKDDWELV